MQKKVSTLVTEYIIKEIKIGNFQLGSKLPSERELMQIINVGRSSVREALSMLVDMGVLEKRMGIGVFVKKTDTNNLVNSYVLSALLDKKVSKELLDFRLMLEVEVCGKAALMAKNEDLEKLKYALDLHLEAIELDKSTIESDTLFHKAIVLATRNSVICNVYEYISDLLYSLKVDLVKVDKTKSYYYHQRIYEAIKAQDVEEARKVMRNHLLDVTQRYESMHKFEQKNN